MTPKSVVQNRPAEVGGAATAVAVLLAHVLGVNDAGTIAALAVVVGLVPAAVTFLVRTIRSG